MQIWGAVLWRQQRITMSKILVTNDLFDIAWRLTAVKDSYLLYYNTDSNRYEVHDSARFPNTLQFVVPYDSLDARTVDYARYSRVENAQAIFADVDKHNAKLEREQTVQSAECVADNISQRRFNES